MVANCPPLPEDFERAMQVEADAPANPLPFSEAGWGAATVLAWSM